MALGRNGDQTCGWLLSWVERISISSVTNDFLRRTAAARLPVETFLERPVFGVKRPFSNAWGIRGARGGQISIQRRRRDAEPVCDLSHADVGIGEHRLGGLDVVVSCAL